MKSKTCPRHRSGIQSPIQSGTKSRILKALFAEAKKLGIGQETLRDDIAPGVISKRLSAATPQEVAKVLIHIHNRHGIPDAPPPFSPSEGGQMSPAGGGAGGGIKRYESSRAGLLEEIRDLAIARFGEDYALPLNAFCARFGEPDGFRRMRVNQMKIIKQRLKELQREDPRNPGTTDFTDGTDKREDPRNPPPLSPSEGGDVSPAGGGAGGGIAGGGEKVIIFQKGRKGFWNQSGGMDW